MTLDDKLYVWDALNGELIYALQTGFVNDLPSNGAMWLASGEYIVHWATDGTIRFWDASTGQLTCLLQHLNTDGSAYTESPVRIAIDESTEMLASGALSINIWDYSSCVQRSS